MEAGEGVEHELVELDADPSDADHLEAAALGAYRQWDLDGDVEEQEALALFAAHDDKS